MAEPRGRPKTLNRRHILEVKKDTREWIEEQLERFTDRRALGKQGRILGAAVSAAGVYMMVRLVNQFGRGIAEGVKNLAADIFVGISIPVINVFTGIFSRGRLGEIEVRRVHGEEIDVTLLQELGQFDPFAFGAALTAGGMVLAGLNPGEILKGIGSIIDALIPL